ncbi:ubiquitin-conjugating enzyme E2 K isoform 2-T2 [Vipera latastei]
MREKPPPLQLGDSSWQGKKKRKKKKKKPRDPARSPQGEKKKKKEARPPQRPAPASRQRSKATPSPASDDTARSHPPTQSLTPSLTHSLTQPFLGPRPQPARAPHTPPPASPTHSPGQRSHYDGEEEAGSGRRNAHARRGRHFGRAAGASPAVAVTVGGGARPGSAAAAGAGATWVSAGPAAEMANIAVQRIKREFKEVLKSEETNKNQIKVDLVDENFTELRGEIAGPPDTPYEGGRYQLEIKIPETYPFNPPKVW